MIKLTELEVLTDDVICNLHMPSLGSGDPSLHYNNLIKLTKKFLEEGQTTPITVRKLIRSNKYLVVAGVYLYMIAVALKIPTVKITEVE